MIGSHNAFRVQPTDQTKLAMVELAATPFGPGVDDLDVLFSYSHKSLKDQLDLGIRVFEFKVYPDPEGGAYSYPKLKNMTQIYDIRLHNKQRLELQDLEDNFESPAVQEQLNDTGFKVMRVPDYDFQSTCYKLTTCLQEIKDWSNSQKQDHLPIFILIQLAGFQDIFDLYNLNHPVNMTTQSFRELEQEILQVMGTDSLVLQQNLTNTMGSSLPKSWPKISQVKNKFFFIMTHLTLLPYEMYMSLHDDEKNTEPKVFFSTVPPGFQDSGFVFLGEPQEGILEQQMIEIEALVKKGYIAIIRAEGSYRGNNGTKCALLNSGAQLITSHFPKSPQYMPNYEYYFVAFDDDGLLVKENKVAGNDLIASDDIKPEWQAVPISRVQFISTHNSYVMQPQPWVWNVLRSNINNTIPGFPKSSQLKNFMVSHRPLQEQLDMGIRQLQLDVFPDPEGGKYADRSQLKQLAQSLNIPIPQNIEIQDMYEPGYKVMHVPEFDFNSHCWLFTDCLQQIQNWSVMNKGHALITIIVEIKSQPFTSLLSEDKKLFEKLEQEISQVFSSEKILTVSDLQGDYDSMNAKIQKLGYDAWPTLQQTQDKIMFVTVSDKNIIEQYSNAVPADNRIPLLFGYGDQDPQDGWMFVADPVKSFEVIRSKSQQGYLVSTRADKPGFEGITGDTTTRDAAFGSGAQSISTDYPQVPNYGIQFSNYHVSFDNGSAFRVSDMRTQIINMECSGFPSKQGGQYFLMVLLGTVMGMMFCVFCGAYFRKPSYRELEEENIEMASK